MTPLRMRVATPHTRTPPPPRGARIGARARGAIFQRPPGDDDAASSSSVTEEEDDGAKPQGVRAKLSKLSAEVKEAMQGGERRTWKEELVYWRLGTVLFVRDCRRDLPLVLRAEHELDHERERAARMSSDLKALVPFLFIAMNTVPFTPVIMPVLLRYVPQRFILPSSYSDSRLRPLYRLRSKQLDPDEDA